MTTLVFTHPACIEHDPGPRHPERPDRLRAVLAALDAPEFAGLERREAPRAERAQIARVHDVTYIDAVFAAVPSADSSGGSVHLDPDTALSPGSGEAALRAAGAVCAAVDAAVAGECDNAFCAVRPPGHHAEHDHAMGFCVFNNVAVAALHARAGHGLERIAVMDFDVHHGNGTQHMFETDAGLFYGSTHQYPYYPGTGAADERGVGNIANAPLPAGAKGPEFRDAMEARILPGLRAFNPDILLISAGFDAHFADPLAGLELTEADYTWATEKLAAVAKDCCEGRLVSTLEGGYDLEALATSTAAHLRALMAV